MSKTKFCDECGYAMDINETRCPECGAEVKNPVANEPAVPSPGREPVALSPGRKTTDDGAADAAAVGIGKNANIMGSVNTTTSNTSHTNTNVQTNNQTNTNVQTSNVDNSSVVNNTTIVMEGKKTPEFCEVCGSPFEEKHARCPKCGKMICFDCKVKGKNRCVECEKKAVNEYRMTFQQLLLTTNGNIGAAGRQMMNQKARDLEVEEVKAAIEKELMEEYKPTTRAEQPTVAPNASKATSTAATESATAKGGVVDNRAPLRPTGTAKKSGGGSSKWLVLIVLLAVGAGAYFLLGKGDATEAPVPEETVTEQPAAPAASQATSPSKPTATTVTQPTPQPQSAPAVTAPAPKPATAAKPAAPQRDVNYEAGMAAYNQNDGLEAISKFKASGSAEANYMLGVIYEKGCGNVAANAMMARSFFKKAANQGHAGAKAKL